MQDAWGIYLELVPRVGLEPTRCHHHRILSPARLPISPPRQGEREVYDSFCCGQGRKLDR